MDAFLANTTKSYLACKEVSDAYWIKLRQDKIDDDNATVDKYSKHSDAIPIDYDVLYAVHSAYPSQWKDCLDRLKNLRYDIVGYTEDATHVNCRQSQADDHYFDGLWYRCYAFEFVCKCTSWYFTVQYDLDGTGDSDYGIFSASKFYDSCKKKLMRAYVYLHMPGDIIKNAQQRAENSSEEYILYGEASRQYMRHMMMQPFGQCKLLDNFNAIPAHLTKLGFVMREFYELDFPYKYCDNYSMMYEGRPIYLHIVEDNIYVSLNKHGYEGAIDSHPRINLFNLDLSVLSAVVMDIVNDAPNIDAIKPIVDSINENMKTNHVIFYNLSNGNLKFENKYSQNSNQITTSFGRFGFPHDIRDTESDAILDLETCQEYSITCSFFKGEFVIKCYRNDIVDNVVIRQDSCELSCKSAEFRQTFKTFIKQIYSVYGIDLNI
jgi:hypothetical protein